MKNVFKTMSAIAALGIMGATPAHADYVIMQDTSMPSVLFFEFDEPVEVETTVISAPVQAPVSPTVNVISPEPVAMAPSTNATMSNTMSDPLAGPISFADQVNQNASKSPDQLTIERATDFEQKSGAELEQAVQNAAAEDQIFSDAGLR